MWKGAQVPLGSRWSMTVFRAEQIIACCNAPSPMPEFSRTPQENHMAEESVRASSSSSSLFTLNRPNGLENKSKSSSDVPYLVSPCLLPCPKHSDAALQHSSLQTTLVPTLLFTPGWLHSPYAPHTAFHVPSAGLQSCLPHASAAPITFVSRIQRPSV